MKTTIKIFATLMLVQLMNSGLNAQKIADSTMQKIKGERAFYETLGKIYAPDSNVKVLETTIAGVKSHWYNKSLLSQKRIIIYLHGGMYALGTNSSYNAMVSHLSHQLNSSMLFIEYSLAPEAQYPTANNEILKVYKELRKQYPDYVISVMGDSAGGGLAISLVDGAIKSKLPLPNSLALISPWVDLKCENSSYTTKQAVDPILSKKTLQDHALLYAPGKIKEADPGELKFSKFPPVLILVGTDEVLNDDSKNFYNSVKTVQKNSKLKEFEGQKHVWLVSDIHSKASMEAINDIKVFF